jgi:uncharacterized protein DUF4333
MTNQHQGASPWAVPPAAWAASPPRPAPRSRLALGLAVTSLLLSLLALVAVVAIGALLFLGGGDEPLTGQIPGVQGQSLPGPGLAAAVRGRIQADGGDVTAMTCPATPRVAQGVVTVCHGQIDGGAWAVVVYFEDASGTYTLAPL